MPRSVTIATAEQRRAEAVQRLRQLVDPDGLLDEKQMAIRLAKMRDPVSDDNLILRIELAYLSSIAVDPMKRNGGVRYVDVVVQNRGGGARRCCARPTDDPALDGSVRDLTEDDESKRRKFSIIKPLSTTVEATTRTKRKKVTGV